MTKDEVLKMLGDIEKDIVRVYEGQIHGEEMFPYVVGTQERVRRIKQYINGEAPAAAKPGTE